LAKRSACLPNGRREEVQNTRTSCGRILSKKEIVLSDLGRATTTTKITSFEHEFAIDCRHVEFEKWRERDVVLSRSFQSFFIFQAIVAIIWKPISDETSQRTHNFFVAIATIAAIIWKPMETR